MGILLPSVRGGSVTGAAPASAAAPVGPAVGEADDDADDADAPYARWNRLTTGLLGPAGPAPGFSSVQSDGGGFGSHPSIVACGMTMLIRFSTFVSSSPWSLATNVNAL